MMNKRILSIFLLLFCFIDINAQKLTVENFDVKSKDLKARRRPRQDINGVDCALVKVRLAAENASFSGNVVGDVEYDKSEYFVYMSHGSKRMTIKLEGYLPLEVNFEDYEIKSLKGKTVYVMIVSRDILPIHFYAGIGFNAVSLMGPSAHLGIRYKIFSLEGGFVYGMDKVDNVSLTLQGSSSLSEAYDYSCSKAWAGIGLNFNYEQFRIAPQVGATFNMISGKSLTTSGTDYFKDSNPMSIFVALRLSYEVVNHLRIHVTPQYDFSLNGDQIFTVIKEADNKIKAWGEGFGINAGVIYEF